MSSFGQRAHRGGGIWTPRPPGPKPQIHLRERSRGFENPLPRTKSPGLARRDSHSSRHEAGLSPGNGILTKANSVCVRTGRSPPLLFAMLTSESRARLGKAIETYHFRPRYAPRHAGAGLARGTRPVPIGFCYDTDSFGTRSWDHFLNRQVLAAAGRGPSQQRLIRNR
jgi:hypothetical protein